MPRRHLRFLTLFFALIIAALTSCTAAQDKETLPDGARLLTDSAQAMRTVTTTRFIVDVQGTVPEIRLRSADGRLKRDGSAKGTASLSQGDQLVELEFVILGDALYLRPPTGQVQRLPLSLAGAVYNPSAALNPDRGIAAVLTSGTGAITEAREQVNNVDSYRVRATFPAQPLNTLIPGPPRERTGHVWIAAQGSQLVQAQFPGTDGTITVRLSEFDVPVEITPLT